MIVAERCITVARRWLCRLRNASITNRFWLAMLVVLLTNGALKGARLPNIWSYTHFLFNYQHGFVKRGAIGALLDAINIASLGAYEFFVAFSFAFLCANIALLDALCWQLIKTQHLPWIGCALLFASGLAIVYLSHTVGYFDHIGLFVTLLALITRGFYKKLLLIAAAFPFAIIIHEATLIIFFPVAVMSLLLELPTPDF